MSVIFFHIHFEICRFQLSVLTRTVQCFRSGLCTSTDAVCQRETTGRERFGLVETAPNQHGRPEKEVSSSVV